MEPRLSGVRATVRRPLVNARFRPFMPRYNRRSSRDRMNSASLRILDANANRAREALRVIEDFARFGLDDAELSAALKQLRHDFAGSISGFVADAVLHRDTPGDVGTLNKTVTEQSREDVAHVVTAAG